jgi:hypothetical protein
LEIAISLGALSFYRVTGRASSFLAGILFCGAAFSFLLGVVMLPLSLIGLLLIIGVFGFTPFVTSLIFLRNAVRCASESSASLLPQGQSAMVLLGAALAFGVPFGLQSTAIQLTNRAIADIQSDSELTSVRAVQLLQRWHFAADMNKLVSAYQATTDEKLKQRIAKAFQTVTGQPIERRIAELND